MNRISTAKILFFVYIHVETQKFASLQMRCYRVGNVIKTLCFFEFSKNFINFALSLWKQEFSAITLRYLLC